MPSHADLTEIENSSRLSADGPVLTMSMPIVTRVGDSLKLQRLRFRALAPDRLVTLRFAPSLVFERFPGQPHDTGAPGEAHSAFIFAGLLEAIVDRQADVLEKLRHELDELSHQVFHHRFGSKGQAMASRAGAMRRPSCRRFWSRWGAITTPSPSLRDSQLGVARIAPYVEGAATGYRNR